MTQILILLGLSAGSHYYPQLSWGPSEVDCRSDLASDLLRAPRAFVRSAVRPDDRLGLQEGSR